MNKQNEKKKIVGMEIKNVYKESWEQALFNKTKDELVYIIQHKENYAPEFISMVEEKLGKEYGVTNVEPTPNVEYTPHRKPSDLEIKLKNRLESFFSSSLWVVGCVLLGLFSFLCAWQASEKFYYWHYLDGCWFSFAALCSGSILFFIILWKVKNYLGSRKNKHSQDAPVSNMNEIRARDLFLETLTKIGCQYEVEEGEDGNIHFGYQGEYFTVRANNECAYVQIWDLHWGHVELYDVDELSRLRKAINESNLRNSVIAVYTVDETGGNMNVHCKSIILFIPEIPNLENYLRMELNEYFLVHQFIGTEMARQRESEAKNA